MLFYSSCEISVATYCPTSLFMYVVALLKFLQKIYEHDPFGGPLQFPLVHLPPRALPDLTIIVRLTIIGCGRGASMSGEYRICQTQQCYAGRKR